MKTRWITAVSVCIFLAWPVGGFADDTQIYSVSGDVASKPNVLIIFDNNAGMGDSANAGDSYNPSTTYPGSYISNGVYKNVTTNQNTSYVYMNMTLSGVTCASAHSGLATNGTWTSSAGSGLKSNGSCGNGGQNIVYLGNLLNYNSAQSSGSSQTEVDAVRQALIGVNGVGGMVNDARKTVNFGLMVFGTNKSGGRLITPVQDLSSDAAYNAFVAALPPATPLLNGNGRPLAESLYDAGIYYQGDYSNSSLTITNQNGNYPSPITASCQKNFVIMITNGDTDGDGSPKLKTNIGDFDGNGLEPGAYGSGTHYLDDVAKYLYERTLLSTGQHIITHTVLVFSPQKDLLQLAADSNHGHGSYHLAADANALSNALTEVLASIVLEANTSYVAPVVPVSPENRTYSGDYVYIGFFRPSVNALWAGNVKKYKIVSGQIVDKNGAAATNSDGSFKDTSVSYWSASSDGGIVEEGGVGSVLVSMTLSPTANYDLTNANMRKIYTYFGTNSQLKHTSNQFVTANASVTPTALGLGATDTTGRDNLVKFIHGQDAYDQDDTPGTTNTRPWILGDVLHSGPAVVAYSATRSVVYGGANDGMLHAFDDATGRELWAYIPNDQLATLWKLNGTVHSYFVDGSPKAYILDNNGNGVIESSNGDKVYLIFGERRGGTTYHAIDVTDPDDPRFLWDIKRGDSGLGELGQTWAAPAMKKIKISSGVKNVFFVGGGYDPVNEDAQPATTDTQGRSIYAIEVETGNRIWSYTVSNNTSMTYAIPSDVAMLDTDRNGYVDRLYVG
ncbi:MAG: hypothetical protein HY203_02225, partial [Nitrospirae bacterium]|nr:hypothetical protein [Nitrospirota bacterium]